MGIEQLKYIEHACRTHQLEQSDAYKKICPTNKMLISIQAESVWEDRKGIIVNLLKNTQELIISESLINDLYWNATTLVEQLPNIRKLMINYKHDEEYMWLDKQIEEIKKKWFNFYETEDSFIFILEEIQ